MVMKWLRQIHGILVNKNNIIYDNSTQVAKRMYL